jgi:hypothetical protein
LIAADKFRYAHQGQWSAGQDYPARSIVKLAGASYYSPTAVSAGVAPPASPWQLGLPSEQILSEPGEILVRQGGAPAALPAGDSGSFLSSNGAGPQWQQQRRSLRGRILGRNRPLYAAPGTTPWLRSSGHIPFDGCSDRVSLGPVYADKNTCGTSNHHLSYLDAMNAPVFRGSFLEAATSETQIDSNCRLNNFCPDNGPMLPGDRPINILRSGNRAAYLLTEFGDVWYLGVGTSGQAGAGTTNNENSWIRCPYLGSRATYNNLPCDIIGLTVACWNQVIAGAATGWQYTDVTVYAIDSSLRLWTWGHNQFGECGLGNTTTPITVPTLVQGLDSGVVQVSAGGHHAALVTELGTLYTFGKNAHGALGVGDTTDRSSPQRIDEDVYQVLVVDGEDVVSSAWNHQQSTYYLKNNGEAYGSGSNISGNLGIGNSTEQTAFQRIAPGQTFAALHAIGGAYYQSMLAIGGTPGSPDGNVWAWGEGEGLGANTTTNRDTPALMGTNSSASQTATSVDGVLSPVAIAFPQGNIAAIFPASGGGANRPAAILMEDNGRPWYLGSLHGALSINPLNASDQPYPTVLPSPWSGGGDHQRYGAILDAWATGFENDAANTSRRLFVRDTRGLLYGAGCNVDGSIDWSGHNVQTLIGLPNMI